MQSGKEETADREREGGRWKMCTYMYDELGALTNDPTEIEWLTRY